MCVLYKFYVDAWSNIMKVETVFNHFLTAKNLYY